MLNILHLINGFRRGGAEILLSQGFLYADHDQFAFHYGYFLHDSDEIAEELLDSGARVHCFNRNSYLSIFLSVFNVRKYIKQHNIQLIHAHLPLSGIVARIAGTLAGVPIIYTEHAPPGKYRFLIKFFSRITWSMQNRIIAISDDVANSVRETYGKSVPIQVIWNGIDTRRFNRSHAIGGNTRKHIGTNKGHFLIGNIASLRKSGEKRIDVWLEAAKKIYEKEPSVRFVLLGDGAQRHAMEQKSKALGLSGIVTFAGSQTDVVPYLARMDLFLISSSYEGFGLAAVEAMAMGVPIIATNVPGLRNVITSHRNGILVDFDDDVASHLANAALSLFEDKRLRSTLAENGRQVAVERFSIQRMQSELEKLYHAELRQT